MAFICRYTTRHGVALSDAYVNILHPRSVKAIVKVEGKPPSNTFSVNAEACIFASKAAFVSGAPAIEVVQVADIHDPATPLHAAAYAAAKALVKTTMTDVGDGFQAPVPTGPLFGAPVDC